MAPILFLTIALLFGQYSFRVSCSASPNLAVLVSSHCLLCRFMEFIRWLGFNSRHAFLGALRSVLRCFPRACAKLACSIVCLLVSHLILLISYCTKYWFIVALCLSFWCIYSYIGWDKRTPFDLQKLKRNQCRILCRVFQWSFAFYFIAEYCNILYGPL